MKTTPQALKKLYESLGGASADVENLSLTPDLIEAIAEVAPTGGGGGVEIITLSAEEQKALNTAMTAASTAAAADTGVNHMGNHTGGLSETTFHKIRELYSSGKNVNLQINYGGKPLVLTPTAHIATGSGNDSELTLTCTAFGQAGNIAALISIAFICEYDASSYLSVVGVSVCVPKTVE